MTNISEETMVKFLVRRKFPGPLDDSQIAFLPSHIGPILVGDYSPGFSGDSWQEVVQIESYNYEKELDSMLLNKLNALYESEIKKNNLEIEAKGQEIDRSLYEHPEVEADLDYWSKQPSWELDEAIALSLGTSPEIVN